MSYYKLSSKLKRSVIFVHILSANYCDNSTAKIPSKNMNLETRDGNPNPTNFLEPERIRIRIVNF